MCGRWLRRQKQAPAAAAAAAAAAEQAVCGRPAPVGVTADELKLDLGSSSPLPVSRGDRTRSAPPSSQTTSDEDDEDDADASHSAAARGSTTAAPLRDHVASMARRYVDDGKWVRRSVLEHLHR